MTLKETGGAESSPTGSVAFAAGTTGLGTATVTNGVATLYRPRLRRPAATLPRRATYHGDSNNAASTSNAVTIVIAAPDFTVTATPMSGTIPVGQNAAFTFTVTSIAGYAGTVKSSRWYLAPPAQAACSFAPASATPSGSSPASSTLTTITTAAATAADRPNQVPKPYLPPWMPAGGLALAGAIGITFAPRKTRRWSHPLRLLSVGLLWAPLSLSVLGCGGAYSSPLSLPYHACRFLYDFRERGRQCRRTAACGKRGAGSSITGLNGPKMKTCKPCARFFCRK